MVRGISGVIADAASMSVMVERIGYLNPRWQSIKRKRFLHGRENIIVDGGNSATEGEVTTIPHHSGSRRNRRRRRRQHSSRSCSSERAQRQEDSEGSNSNTAMSSLSSSASAESSTSSNSSNSSREDDRNRERKLHQNGKKKKRSSSALAHKKRDGPNLERDGENGTSHKEKRARKNSSSPSNIDGGDTDKKNRLSPLSSEESSSSSNHGKNNENADQGSPADVSKPSSTEKKDQKSDEDKKVDVNTVAPQSIPGVKIAKSGGIVHNIRPVLHDLSSSTAAVVAAVAPPAQNTPGSAMAPNYMAPVPIPSLSQPQPPVHASNPRMYYVGPEYVRRRPIVPAVILNDPMGCTEELGAYYSINEDDMILMDDILMCPFVFRSKNAVLCGALADCVMPGMLRAQFSPATNKLSSVEMVYDAMGFMQQLDRSNGGEVTAQIIPGSLEMALMHTPHEARAVTEAKAPYSVVHVNEAWTKLTKYTQIEAAGQELWSLLQGENTVAETRTRPGKPAHILDEVAQGLCACSSNLHYNKNGRPYIDFMCSYPLTK